MTQLETENLNVYFGDFQALFGITMHVEPGDTMALVGANGANKTRLWRAGQGRTVRADLSFGASWALQSQLIKRVLSPDPMSALPLTFGLSVILQNLMVGLYGANTPSIDIGPVKTARLEVGGFTLGYLPLATFLLALGLFGLLHLGLQRGRLDRAIRATAQDGDIIALFGIRQRRIFPLVMALIHVASFYFDPASGLLYRHLTLLLFLLLRLQDIAGKVVT